MSGTERLGHRPYRRIAIAAAVLLGAALVGLVALRGFLNDPIKASQAHETRAKDYADAGRYREAVLEYRNAVKKAPRSGSLRYGLGETYLKAGDPARAAREFVRAADLLPDDVTVQVTAAEALVALGRYEEARRRAEAVVARDPRNVRAQVALGRSKAFLKDLDGAIADLQEAIRVDPAQPQTHVTLGALELTRGNAMEAEDAFKKAIAVDRTYIEAHLALTSLYLKEGKATEAEQALKAGVAGQPDHPMPHWALAVLYLVTGRGQDAVGHLDVIARTVKDVPARIRLADLYTATGELNIALSILEPIARDKEKGVAAAPRVAAIYYARGDKARAHRVLDEVVDRPGPGPFDAVVLKARLLAAENKLDQALRHAENAVRLNATSASAQYVLGTIQAARSDYDAALKAFNEVLRLNPRATAAQVQLSQIQLAQGQAAQSVQTAEAAVKNAPGSPASHLALARALIANGDHSRAAAELQRLKEKFPANPAVHVQLGHLAQARNEIDRAVAAYTDALKFDPVSTDALAGLIATDLARRDADAAKRRIEVRLAKEDAGSPLLILGGRLYARLGDYSRAEHLLEDAIAKDPDNLAAYDLLAHVLLRAGKVDAAKSRYEALAKKQHRPVAAHTMVGIILQTQNKRGEARTRYEQALQIDPEAAVAANNLAWMSAEDNASLDEALRLARIAKRKLPDMAEVDDTLGWILYKKDRVGEAIAAVRRAVEANPDVPLYHYHLGMAYLKYGDWSRAAASLQRSLAISSAFDGASEARAALDRLGVSAGKAARKPGVGGGR